MTMELVVKRLRNLRHLAEIIIDTHALKQISPLVGSSYLPWSSSSLRPRGLVYVLNDILINGRSCVVECGGGISTFLISELLSQQRHGHLYCIEHNAEWAKFLKRQLKLKNLNEFCTVITASLSKSSFQNSPQWYDEDSINKYTRDKVIDLLLVDGPPAHGKGNEKARYAAVPFFKEHLAEGFTIILDDINRAGEQEIIKKWGAILNQPYRISKLFGGDIGIITTSQCNIF